MAEAGEAPHGQIRLRGTFIDISDATRLASAQRPSRAQSAPCLRGPEEELDVLPKGAFYVSHLSDTLVALWGGGGEESRTAAAARAFFADSRHVETLGAQKAAARDALGDGTLRSAAASTSPGGSTSTTKMDAVGAMYPSPSSDASESELAVISVGSIGHPHLCSRPCLYFASGTCANGGGCEFCHHPHTKRAAYLDKKHREALQDMPQAQAKALIFPVLREKALAFDDSPGTVKALDELAKMCRKAPGTAAQPAGRKARSERVVSSALAATSLRMVLISLKRTAFAGEAQGQAAVEILTQRLRRAAGAN